MMLIRAMTPQGSRQTIGSAGWLSPVAKEDYILQLTSMEIYFG
jgi:hypothetical protein